MKRLFLFFLLIPQLAYSQYLSLCFQPDKSNEIEQSSVGASICEDTTILLNRVSAISGFVVTGQATLSNLNDSYIKIILKDNYNYEYLVYENYPMLSGRLSSDFSNTAMETILLNDITPHSMKVEIHNASLRLDSYGFISTSLLLRGLGNSPKNIQREQTQYLVERLNSNLKQQNQTWRAGITSISQKSYEEKKSLFGGKVPELYGLEHYIGGIFVIPSSNVETNNIIQNRTSNQYVSEWDWRNRHGKNWMTAVKDQSPFGTCWAFSTVGAIEAYINLYYNRLLNYDLSEQDLVSCSSAGNTQEGNIYQAFGYVKNSGIVLENCFPYVDTITDCSNKCVNPTEKIYIQKQSSLRAFEERVKKKLFISPLAIGISSWEHGVVFAGYKTIRNGDIVYCGDSVSNNHNLIILNTTTHPELIGKTAWLFKNSFGPGWGDSGYGYVVMDMMSYGDRIYSNSGKITSMVYTDNDVICEDADGDGYYFWGIGEKPSYCPNWIPDIPDGNDANANEGSADVYGFLEKLNPDTIPPLVINSNVEYNVKQSIYSNIRITQNGTLNLTDTLNLFGHVTIIIENEGKLIIDGGVITNAHIVMNEGSQLKLLNNGLLVCRTDDDFYAPMGAVVEIECGKICNSHDY